MEVLAPCRADDPIGPIGAPGGITSLRPDPLPPTLDPTMDDEYRWWYLCRGVVKEWRGVKTEDGQFHAANYRRLETSLCEWS